MEKNPRGEEAREKRLKSPHVMTMVGRGPLGARCSGCFYLTVLFISSWEGNVRTLIVWMETVTLA